MKEDYGVHRGEVESMETGHSTVYKETQAEMRGE